MNFILNILESLALGALLPLSGWRLLHYFQLESYQLPGYYRSLKRNAKKALLPGLAMAAVGVLAAVLGLASVLRMALMAAGEKAGAKTQVEVLPYGGTDAGAMQRSRAGIPVCTLSIPCRYVHSACEVIDMRDMDAALKLMQAYFA